MYVNNLRNLPFTASSILRKLENVKRKIIKCKWSIVFNETCLNENILPNYTNIRYHDPAVEYTSSALTYRKSLVRRELEEKKNLLIDLENHEKLHHEEFTNYDYDESIVTKPTIITLLNEVIDSANNVQKIKTLKKLNELYHGQVMLKDQINSFINLSRYTLTSVEEQFLNLGLNFHIQGKYDKLHKQTEMEILYNNIIKLQENGKVTIKQGFPEQLAAESNKHRNTFHRSIITPQLRTAAQELRNNQNIVIRKADKSNLYVILDKEDYLTKIDNILSDGSKFKRIEKDSTNSLKKRANDLIQVLNADQSGFKLNKIVGDYSPGYMYGTVKIHKANNPLRPIISQCPTPTYQLAKDLNNIITPFMPTNYSLRSTNDFIDILQTTRPQGIIASLDVESLFTNVPIDSTINIILQHVYNHPTIKPPKIPSTILKQLLELCTKQSPFRCPRGKYYLQVEGVAMGSPLGPTFANFYMGHLEQSTFQDITKPNIYARYVDDIFIDIENEEKLLELKQIFENKSVLKFTYELHTQNKLPFLDVLVTSTQNGFKTDIYRKPTNQGMCLNGKSECPEKYKLSVISNYLSRAYKVTQTWEDFISETLHIKQLLINNNYTNSLVDEQINKFMSNKFNQNPVEQKGCKLTLYYHNQMHKNHKTDEKILKDILKTNVICTDPNNVINLIIYYKNRKTSNLVMRNNTSPPISTLQQNNLVYAFNCPLSHSKATAYIGYTECTLERRITGHSYNGSIKQHFLTYHDIKPTKELIANNTTILTKANDKQRLTIKEALLILRYSPVINRQFDNFQHTLKLHKHHITNEPNIPNIGNIPVQHQTSQPNSQTLPQPSTPSAPPLSPINATHSTPHRLNITNNMTVSPNIQHRIDTLMQATQVNNQQFNNNQLSPSSSPYTSTPYNLRPR